MFVFGVKIGQRRRERVRKRWSSKFIIMSCALNTFPFHLVAHPIHCCRCLRLSYVFMTQLCADDTGLRSRVHLHCARDVDCVCLLLLLRPIVCFLHSKRTHRMPHSFSEFRSTCASAMHWSWTTQDEAETEYLNFGFTSSGETNAKPQSTVDRTRFAIIVCCDYWVVFIVRAAASASRYANFVASNERPNK